MKIALAGNPNSGKTTMYNAITGSNETVGNWAGVTVEKKEAYVKKGYYNGSNELIAVDLPGAYSMSPFTSEEGVTSEYIKNENPDVIINIVDATNLSRSLFFSTQLLELGIPMIIALNKSDINKKRHTIIDKARLSELLGCPVVDTVSTSAEGLSSLISRAILLAGKVQKAPYSDSNSKLKDRESALGADERRFRFVNQIVADVERRNLKSNRISRQDKIDAWLINKWIGIPIFALVMFFVFWISQAGIGVWIADYLSKLLSLFQEYIASLMSDASPILKSLLIDGVMGGAIAVIGFLPLVMVMYFMIALLEDCGYMARVSALLDPIFKRVGLSGKSVIPFIIGTGCAIPGIMACRTIRDERERRATAMLAPFMPCGAKLPVIALFAGAFFPEASWIGVLMYFVGIVIIFLGALIINKLTAYKAQKSYFIIELPEYKVPSISRAFQSMCGRGKEYIVKAATIILLCNTAVQVMQSFDWRFKIPESADSSILASIASPFSYILLPIVGIASWQLAAAAITGFIAKENVVGTLAVCFGISNLINTDELVMFEGKGSEVALAFGIGKIAALAYLMFNLFTPPCFAAIGAMNSEIKSRKWFFGGIAFQFAMGFSVSYLVYTVGTLIVNPSALAVLPALIGLFIVALIAAVLIYICINAKRKV